MSSEGQESWRSFAGWFWLRVAREWVWVCHLHVDRVRIRCTVASSPGCERTPGFLTTGTSVSWCCLSVLLAWPLAFPSISYPERVEESDIRPSLHLYLILFSSSNILSPTHTQGELGFTFERVCLLKHLWTYFKSP